MGSKLDEMKVIHTHRVREKVSGGISGQVPGINVDQSGMEKNNLP